MTNGMTWAALLDTSKQVFEHCTKLARKFKSQHIKVPRKEPLKDWSKYSSEFEALRTKFRYLLNARKNPPDGFEGVAVHLNEVGKCILSIIDCESRDLPLENFLKHFSDLDRSSQAGIRVLKKCGKMKRSPDSLAIVNEPKSVEPVNTIIESRFPQTIDGHIGFLGWVHGEVRDQAKYRRKEKYEYEIIEKQLKDGVKWTEAMERFKLIHGLPDEVLAAVKSVLDQVMTPESVEDIARDLGEPLKELRRARNCQKQGKPYTATTDARAPDSKSKPKSKGRPKATYDSEKQDKSIVASWKKAKEAKVSKMEFCKQRGYKIEQLDAILDREYHRNRNSVK